MTIVKAPCLNRTCKETAEFKKGAIKYISSCPNCGTQFYQSKKAKQDVEDYLEKHTKASDDDSKEVNKNNERKPVADSKDESKVKPKKRALFSRQWRKKKEVLANESS